MSIQHLVTTLAQRQARLNAVQDNARIDSLPQWRVQRDFLQDSVTFLREQIDALLVYKQTATYIAYKHVQGGQSPLAETYLYLCEHYLDCGWIPNGLQMAAHFHLSDVACYKRLDRLIALGYLRKTSRSYHDIQFVKVDIGEGQR